MKLKAVFHSSDHAVLPKFVSDVALWFDIYKGSYVKDRDAIRQVLEEDGKVRNNTEAIYIEGCPIPLGSKLNVEEITDAHFAVRFKTEAAEAEKTSFFSKLFGKK